MRIFYLIVPITFFLAGLILADQPGNSSISQPPNSTTNSTNSTSDNATDADPTSTTTLAPNTTLVPTTLSPDRQKQNEEIEKLKNGTLTNTIGNKDCNSYATKETLKFLQGDNTNGPKGSNNCVDKHLTNFDRLREFLTSKDVKFTQNIGSLMFINAQDHVLKLNCTNNDKDTNRYKWTLNELRSGQSPKTETDKQSETDEKEFADDHTDTKRRIVFKAPPDADYYRKYTCERKDKSCKHIIHVITRPYARLTMEPQFREGQKNVEITCEIHKCLYEYTKGKCKVHPRPQNDVNGYRVAWRLPVGLKNKTKNTTKQCVDGVTGEKKTVLYEPENPNDGNNTIRLDKKPFDGTNTDKRNNIKFKPIVTCINKTVNQSVGQTMMITKMEPHYVGDIECIIIDKNGVPSSPTPGSLDSKIRFKGGRKVHVRKLMWTLIPLGILGGMILLIIVVQLACPSKMELDDGTIVSTKMEVAPEPQPEAPPPRPSATNPSVPASTAPSDASVKKNS